MIGNPLRRRGRRIRRDENGFGKQDKLHRDVKEHPETDVSFFH